MDFLEAGAIEQPGLDVRVVQQCASTNTVLLEEPAPRGRTVLLAAEAQTAGRGRRGRRWHAAPGSGVAFSLARHFERPLRELACLSLVAGVAAARALRRLGVERIAIKWPNDLVVAGAKLGGILVETRGSATAAKAVIGIGINCRQVPGMEQRLRRPIAALDQFLSPLPPRNVVIREVAGELLAALSAFEAHGLGAVRHEWEAMHAYAGRRMRLRLADGSSVSGIAAGLADDGGLRLSTRTGERAVASGLVVSARAA